MGIVIQKDSYLENINILKNPSKFDDFDIVFAILNIDNISSKADFDLIINFLTNHSNPIREVLAYKLEDYAKNYENYFTDDFVIKKLSDAVIDINPNVSRSVCNLLSKSKKISSLMTKEIINNINELILKIKDFEKDYNDDFSDFSRNSKNHAKNKKIFSLYWYLEALYFCFSEEYYSEIVKILNYTINFSDYTIREKTAKILTKINNPPCEILKKANTDQNFYVKIQVYDKINNDD